MNKQLTIPEMTHEYGKHWEAPAREDIQLTLSHAWMSKKSFDKLHTYQVTDPTGVYAGKMWKRQYRSRNGVKHWHLVWWYDTSPDHCNTHHLRIGIYNT